MLRTWMQRLTKRNVNKSNPKRGGLRCQRRQRPHLALEMLEDRMVLSTLSVDALGNAHYLGSPGVANNVTLSEKFVPIGPNGLFLLEEVIADTAEKINVTGPGASRWSGSGTNQVITILSIPSLLVDVFDGNEVVKVQAINYATTVRHNGAGVGTVNVGEAGRLSGIQGSLAVEATGVGSLMHLNVDDSADGIPRAVTIGPNSIQFAGIGSSITFLSGVKSVNVFGGSSDTFFAHTLSSTTPVIVHGGSGANTLESGSGFNGWTITGTNAGTLHNVTFTNIQNLRGGPSSFRDTFHFNDKTGVSGTIQGAGGINYIATLDYSKYTTLVSVDLKLSLALAGGLKTGVLHIQEVFGGSGNNILVGNGNNVLKGGSGRDILISGGGTSILQAGSGEAILIGAHYLFDTNLAALDALMAEWSHTYDPINPLHDYQIRVGHLELGGGLNGPFVLNKSTVVPQAGVTTLITGGGLDFLIIDPGDILAKPLRPGEVVLSV